jgi:hypothetical protein
MRQQDACDALGKDLAQALAPAATPTTKQCLDSDGRSLQRKVSKLAPITTMAGMRSHSTIRTDGARRTLCFDDPAHLCLHHASDLQTVQCRKQRLIGQLFSHLILRITQNRRGCTKLEPEPPNQTIPVYSGDLAGRQSGVIRYVIGYVEYRYPPCHAGVASTLV